MHFLHIYSDSLPWISLVFLLLSIETHPNPRAIAINIYSSLARKSTFYRYYFLWALPKFWELEKQKSTEKSGQNHGKSNPTHTRHIFEVLAQILRSRKSKKILEKKERYYDINIG